MRRIPKPLTLKILVYSAIVLVVGCAGVSLTAPLLINAFFDRALQSQKLDISGVNGQIKFKELSQAVIAPGSRCLKGEYTHWQDTYILFVFLSPNLPTVPAKAGKAGEFSFTDRMKEDLESFSATTGKA